MSLLNVTNDGLPNVLVVLFAAVARAQRPLKTAELLEQVAPAEVVAERGKMARQTLNRWTELGLFVTDDDDTVRLAQPLDRAPRDDHELIAAVRKAARALAFDLQNNENFWAAEKAKAADLTRSLAWLLAQDVYSTRFGDLEGLESGQISNANRRLMQNDTRKNGLRFWAHFLGFTRETSGGDIDPTVAIRDVLPECLDSGPGMPADRFVSRLAEVLPVLDGGRWRTEVERELAVDALPRLESGQVSSSLSRALLTLRLGGDVILEQRADLGSSIALTGQSGIRPDYRFHWIARPAEEGDR